MANSVPIAENVLQPARHRLLPWFVWSLGALFFFYELLLQVAPSVMNKEIMQNFTISATSFGYLSSFYFAAYASMQLPAGVLLDRFGPRVLLTFAATLCAVGTLLFGSAQVFGHIELARFITGLGSAFAMLGTLVLVANWFPVSRFAFLHGLTITIGFLGAVFGYAPTTLLVEQFHWRGSMYLLGIIGLVITVLLWLIVRDHPSEENQQPSIRRDSKLRISQVLRALLNIVTHPQSWLTSLYGVLMYAPTTALALWGPAFISTTYGISTLEAASITSVMFIGWCVGCPLFGKFSDRIKRRKFPLYISSVGTLITLVMIVYLPIISPVALSVLLFCFGFFTCGFVPSFSIIRELHPAEASGTALGFMNMINNIGGAIAPVMVGIILDYAWSGQLDSTGTRVYTMGNFHSALLALPVCALAALVVVPFLRETHCKIRSIYDN